MEFCFEIYCFIKPVLITVIAFIVKAVHQMMRNACKTTSTKIKNHGVAAR